MEYIYYCANCDKFFYREQEYDVLSPPCAHCGCEHTAETPLTKEAYANLPADRKDQWKTMIRQKFDSLDSIIVYNHRATSQRYFEQKMGVLFTLKGCRGRSLTVCKNKCIVKTDVTVGSVLTGNATDGEKTVFYKHCSGIQFKEWGMTIGFLQFETPSMQMNNMSSNFFSENTFTYDSTNKPLTNEIMREVYYYMMALIENSINGKEELPVYPPLLADYLKNHG